MYLEFIIQIKSNVDKPVQMVYFFLARLIFRNKTNFMNHARFITPRWVGLEAVLRTADCS